MPIRCTVLGAGSWGTALAVQLARMGHNTVLWDRHPDRCETINREHVNPRYLRSVQLPSALRAESDLQASVEHAELLVTGVPSHALREVMVDAVRYLPAHADVCCATKGIESSSLQTMHGVLTDVLPASQHAQISVLSGPSFALELATSLPTAVAIAGPEDAAQRAAQAFHGQTFRAYHTEDIIGVCVGGSLKNVMAIACGVSDGAGFGSNTRAAIITRGLAEISRLAVAMGANPLTLMGLAGMGDLVLTCTGNLSRNRRVGLALGEGRTLQDILEELGEVAEGVTTAKSAWDLARKMEVDLPITQQVYQLLYEDKPVMEALSDLLGRERRAERD